MPRRRREGDAQALAAAAEEGGAKEDEKTPPSSPSWVPVLRTQQAMAGGDVGPSAGLAVLNERLDRLEKEKKQKRAAYVCRKCGQPKKGHRCPAKMGLAVDLTATPEAFQNFSQPHTLDRGFTQIIDSALTVDVQTLFENAVSSFYDTSRFAPDPWLSSSLLSEGAVKTGDFDRVMFGGTWFEMPITALQSLAGVLREETSNWEKAASVVSSIEDTIALLERSKAEFIEHAKQSSAGSAPATSATPAAAGSALPAEMPLYSTHPPAAEAAAPRLGKRSGTVVLEEEPAPKKTRRSSRRT